MSFYEKLKKGLKKTRDNFSSVFSLKKTDKDVLEKLEEILITSDIGVATSIAIVEKIEKKIKNLDTKETKEIIKQEILSIIENKKITIKDQKPYIIMVVGVNGVGKTTMIGKLAKTFTDKNKKVLMVAGDTFRAAATEQLTVWANRVGSKIIKQKHGTDPSAVVFDGINSAIANDFDVVLIDTAGRLHNKSNLMNELKKIKRTIQKKIESAPHETLLILDATTGQNALNQAEIFNKEIGVTNIAITKLDGTAKGGIVVNISKNLKIPISYISIGERIEDLQNFNPEDFVNALFD